MIHQQFFDPPRILRSSKDFMIHQQFFDPPTIFWSTKDVGIQHPGKAKSKSDKSREEAGNLETKFEPFQWKTGKRDHASFLHELRIATNKTYFKCICVSFAGRTGEQQLQGSTVDSHPCCLSPTRTPWDLLSPRTLEMFSRHQHPGCWQDT